MTDFTTPAGAAVLFGAATLAAAVASVVGFGIGSLLTPLLALSLGMPAAVAAVSIPHVVATAVRAWRLRADLSWRVLRGFGLASAAGGLAGALLQTRLGHAALTRVLGALLVVAGVSALTGALRRLRLRGAGAIAGGALSGAFGGLVGNQGGLRSAALLAFDLPPAALVATATFTGVLVDAARVPVYLATRGEAMRAALPEIAIATAGALLGTLAGERVLRRLPERAFVRVVAACLVALGIALFVRA